MTIIELNLDESGNGRGAMALGVKLHVADGDLEIENYSTEPVRLTSVRKTG